jgi:hypothetical protein
MNPRPETYDLEAELRTMLRRQADEVQPQPPAWSALTQRGQAVVVSLRTGRPLDEDTELQPPAHRPRHQRHRVNPWWREPSLVACAAAILTVAAVWALNRAVSDGTQVASPPEFATKPVPAPGDASFDPRTAPIVWPSNLGSPVEATRQYLLAVGIPTSGAGAVRIVESTNDGEIATVHWSDDNGEGSVPWGGTVFLRNLSDDGEDEHWVIVGAVADGVRLENVRYDGEHLEFDVVSDVVAGAAAGSEAGSGAGDGSSGAGGSGSGGSDGAGPIGPVEPGDMAVTILADEQPVSFGGGRLPDNGPVDPAEGQLLELDANAADNQASAEVAVDLNGRPDVLIRVQPIDGQPISVTEMALEPPAVTVDGTTSTPSPTVRDTSGGGTSATSNPGLPGPDVTPPAGTDGEAGTTQPTETTVPAGEPDPTTTIEPTTETTDTTLPVTLPPLPLGEGEEG